MPSKSKRGASKTNTRKSSSEKKKPATTKRRPSSASASPSPSLERPPQQQQQQQQVNSSFIMFAAIAGVCGALSGVCGKIGVSSTSQVLVDFLMKQEHVLKFFGGGASASVVRQSVEYAFRILMILANGAFTGQMWRYYLKALALGPTPVAQAVNTAANFAVSAFVGTMLFGEVVGWLWLVGAVITACGLGLLLV